MYLYFNGNKKWLSLSQNGYNMLLIKAWKCLLTNLVIKYANIATWIGFFKLRFTFKNKFPSLTHKRKICNENLSSRQKNNIPLLFDLCFKVALNGKPWKLFEVTVFFHYKQHFLRGILVTQLRGQRSVLYC